MTLPGGTKLLKKLFIDRKIPADQRSYLPVLEDDEGILGVFGIGADWKRRASQLPGWQIIIDIQDKE
jgi:tRNA(Ile)-lysidine synthetase-like protein